MGYMTRYSLTVSLYANGKTADHPLAEEIIAELRSDNEWAKYCLDSDGSASDSSKWYEHETDMKQFSLNYRGVLFALHGEGEENEDMWKKYFLNGKCQIAKAQWSIAEFDQLLLQP